MAFRFFISSGRRKSVPNKNTHHLHIELTPEQYQLLNTQAKQCGLAKRGLCLLDQVYELIYQIVRK